MLPRTKMSDIYKVVKKKRTLKSFCMLWTQYQMAKLRSNFTPPDTDIFVLALRRYRDLCNNVLFVTGKRSNRREIRLEPIVEALGQARTAALPPFHALSGADNTASFVHHAKPLCWQAFLNMEEDDVRGIGIRYDTISN